MLNVASARSTLPQLLDRPRPHLLIHDPQRNSLRRDGQATVQQDAAAVGRSQVAHPLGGRMRRQINFRGVLRHQHHGIGRGPLRGPLIVRGEDFAPADVLVFPKAIGGFDLRRAVEAARNAPFGVIR